MTEISADEYSTTKTDKYISCMKINGIPILPPLMTNENRQEMLHYKHLAMAIERKIFDYKFSLDDTTINSNIIPSDSEELFDGVNISYVSDHYLDRVNHNIEHNENNDFESMNSQVTVIDIDEKSYNSNAKVSSNETIDSNLEKNDSIKLEKKVDLPPQVSNDKSLNLLQTTRCSLKHSPRSLGKKDMEKINYNVEIIKPLNITKCNITEKPRREALKSERSFSKVKNGVAASTPNKPRIKKNSFAKKENIPLMKNVPITHKKSCTNVKKSQKLSVQAMKNKVKLSPSKNITGSLNNISSGLASPPKLYRQNSYTLESPSPFLLAHLEEQSLASGVDLRSISMSESTSTSYLCNSSKQKSWDTNTAKETWSSIGSDINSISMNENPEINLPAREDSRPNISNKHCNEQQNKSIEKQECPVKDEISRESFEKSNKEDSKADILNQSNASNRSYSNSHVDASNKTETSANNYLKEILQRVKEEHEKQLHDLIKKQENEQLLLKRAFESQQKMLLEQFEVTLAEKGKSLSDSRKKNSKTNVKCEENFKNLSLSEKDRISERKTDSSKVFEEYVDGNFNFKQFHGAPESNNHDNNKNITTKFETIDLSRFISDNEGSLYDDQDITGRTNNTLDDVNTNFTSDDCLSVIKSPHETSKLKSAFEKISQIQKTLASPPSRDMNSLSFEEKSSPYKEQSISLSFIDIKESPKARIDNFVTNRSTLSLDLIDINRPTCSYHGQKNIFHKISQREIQAATIIVAYSKGYLTRRLMKTEKVQSTVQTIRDTLICAIQLHMDEAGIRGPDVDLHRRLIQQITAACYALHDIFILYTPEERMYVIAQDRKHKILLSNRSASGSSMRQLSATTQKVLKRKMERMSKSHSGVFTTRSTARLTHLSFPHHMTRSHYDNSDHSKSGLSDKSRRSTAVAGELVSRKPWR